VVTGCRVLILIRGNLTTDQLASFNSYKSDFYKEADFTFVCAKCAERQNVKAV